MYTLGLLTFLALLAARIEAAPLHVARDVVGAETWSVSPYLTTINAFGDDTTCAAGEANVPVLPESPPPGDAAAADDDDDGGTLQRRHTGWGSARNPPQVLFPKGSIKYGSTPQGGAGFYASPMDLSRAQNATLEYQVYFPADFEFNKGGGLPGLYGGHAGCSGGNSASNCFSTRMMWRENGLGELNLYAPRHRQVASLCATPPLSICNSNHGLSIGRGAWTFAKGAWTTIRQDIWLNSAGQNDGGFNIWINDQLVLHANSVFYRDPTDGCATHFGVEEPSAEQADADASFLLHEDRLPPVAVAAETSLAKRAPYDDGSWRGIHGYPATPVTMALHCLPLRRQ
ncbi:hypothetical protein P7C73_g6857, partial [Tremellales sp. Uapishka_1]